MADYSLDKRLYDLYRSLANVEEINIYPPTIGKGGKKGDIYRLGVLLKSLIDPDAKMMPVIIPQDLNPTFRDFLQKCLLHDEQERWTAEQLLAHPFLGHTSAIGLLPKEEDEDDIMDDTLNADAVQSSRVYALKRIPLDPSNNKLNRKIFREVKLLSRLNHENIVRYYHSWKEAEYAQKECAVQNDSNKEATESETSTIEKEETSTPWEIHSKDMTTSEEEEEEEDDDDDDDSFIVFMADSTRPDEQQVKKISANAHESASSVDQKNVSSDKETPHKIRFFMYIQMEFCEKSTLRTAIDNGLHKDVCLMWRLFREIVEGLHYMHQQGVIHRDLKPVNIFLDVNDHVKIGDFGLATDVVSKSAFVDTSSVDLDPNSRSEMGTALKQGG
ncbi:eIF-2-alpha kinase GCN2 [Caerostris extrusa]|uniref:EIF-2-alpha kinase GCN2 n=1 Tax=Caerostris extrusa TaxID=172846 RepID=A0AAV4PIM0_CAEEX|nr:eIF-2-alpha kinase GCN2 [Caerostris extrusa]